MGKHTHIELTSEERTELEQLIRTGNAPGYPYTRARILLLSDRSQGQKRTDQEVADAEEAHRLAARFTWHCTPEHGSWLTIAEGERSIVASQCLDRRILDMAALSREVTAWEDRRNRACRKVVWHFTTTDTRIKLRRLYPVIKEQNLTY
jgi:hypothetical protein